MLPFARRCRDFGVSVHLIEVGDEAKGARRPPSWIHRDPGPAMKWSEIGTSAGIERIQRFVASSKADGLISTDELTLNWLSSHRDLFEPRCRVMASPAKVLETLLSKKAQVDIAERSGFHVLPTWYLERAGDGAEIPDSAFPICVRPTYPYSVTPEFKARVFSNGLQMASWLADFVSIRSPLVAQPFRVGPNIIVHAARDIEGKILAMKAYRTVRKFGGVAQSVEGFELSPELQENCRQFAAIAGLVGSFHFDLLHSEAEDRTYYLEVNPRMGGTTSKVIALGYDEPAMSLAAFRMEPPSYDRLATSRQRVTSKRSLAIQIIATLRRGQPDELRYPQESRTATLLNSLRELAFVDDPGISINDLAGSALRRLRPAVKSGTESSFQERSAPQR